MLILSRKQHERIVIRDAAGKLIATVEVLDFRSADRVRLGIVADRSVSVDREEIDAAKVTGAIARAKG